MQFPSLKASELFRALKRKPLNYRDVTVGGGSHRKYVSSAGYPDLLLAFHKGATIPRGLVRKILIKDVGLTEDQALEILKG